MGRGHAPRTDGGSGSEGDIERQRAAANGGDRPQLGSQ